MDVSASQLIAEALALRRSHAHAPAVDVLDLVLKGRGVWLEDFFEYMVPPAPFALLVAEAVDDCMNPMEWKALTDPTSDACVRDALVQLYRESVWLKFVGRYGWTSLQALRLLETRQVERGWPLFL